MRIIDFTGSTEYGDWLEANARQAAVYTEKAGVNTIVVDSTDDFAGMCRNIGFSLHALQRPDVHHAAEHPGARATASTPTQGHKSFDEVAAGIAGAVGKLTGDPAPGGRADRRDRQRRRAGPARRGPARSATVLLDSRPSTHPTYPDAVVRTPLDRASSTRTTTATYGAEWFGPISFVVATDSTAHSLEIFRRTVGEQGRADRRRSTRPIDEVLDAVEEAAIDVGVHLSGNLTGGVFVNQSAAFSDFHATRRQPGRERRADRRRVRGQPVPGRPVPPARA